MALKKIGALLRRVFRRRAPEPGRFALKQKSSIHGFLSVAPAPPWREYLLYVPRGAAGVAGLPLVVWVHGCRQDPEAFAAGTRIARFADERRFVVLLPRQSRMANSERCWNWFDRRTASGAGETAIVASQVSEVVTNLRVDARRVYLAGLSSGGALAATLALRLPSLFRAVAIHSSVPAGAAFDPHDAGRVMARGPNGGTDEVALQARAAAPKARLPALIIHGSADTTVAPVNAVFLVRQFLLLNGLPRDELRAGAALPPAQMRGVHARRSDQLLSEYYVNGRLGAQLLTVPGLGHAWSGGNAAFDFFDDRHLDATRAVCDFFAAH